MRRLRRRRLFAEDVRAWLDAAASFHVVTIQRGTAVGHYPDSVPVWEARCAACGDSCLDCVTTPMSREDFTVKFADPDGHARAAAWSELHDLVTGEP